jgi:hypothetical protein
MLTNFHSKPIRLAEGIEIPTDEELEPEEIEIPLATKKSYPKCPPSLFKDVSLEMDKLDPEFSISTSPPTTPARTTRSKSSTQLKSPLVEAAAALVESYRVSHPKNKATPSSLRCYFLWYQNPGLSLPDIAGMLRVGLSHGDSSRIFAFVKAINFFCQSSTSLEKLLTKVQEVPLQTSTVVNYILESVRAEKLPFDRDRLRQVLTELPKEVVNGRYKTLSRACDVEGVEKTKE